MTFANGSSLQTLNSMAPIPPPEAGPPAFGEQALGGVSCCHLSHPPLSPWCPAGPACPGLNGEANPRLQSASAQGH